MSYSYTKANQVDTMRYSIAGQPFVDVAYRYSNRKWLDSMVATTQNGSQKIFRQALHYDPTGQITRQRWTHGMMPEQTQYYTYDPMQRLTAWGNGGVDSTSYTYDAVGNRSGEIITGTQAANRAYMYGGSVGGSNRLNTLIRNAAQTQWSTYRYNANGSTVGRDQWAGSYTGFGALTGTEDFTYSYRELLRGYVNGSNDWRYRYSASGEREGKRKYQSAQANKPLAWVYYLLGGSKDQLSVWHGLEKQNSCGTTGANVFLYPVEYLTYSTGNNLSTRANGQKEYKLMDHLGSTRVVMDNNGITQEYDYDPFGRQVVVTAATTGGPVREGFIGKEKDSEDNLGDFGVRKYDENLGRFMSTDVLWEKYRGLTPYQYGGNNPLLIKDPTGLELRGGHSVINTTDQPIELVGSGGTVTDGGELVESPTMILTLQKGETFMPTVNTVESGGHTTTTYSGEIIQADGTKRPVPLFDIDGVNLNTGQAAVVEDKIVTDEGNKAGSPGNDVFKHRVRCEIHIQAEPSVYLSQKMLTKTGCEHPPCGTVTIKERMTNILGVPVGKVLYFETRGGAPSDSPTIIYEESNKGK